MYDTLIAQMNKGLGQLELWLGKAATHAQDKGYDPNVLVGMRLAPDQFELRRQVQIACDTVKLAAARLTGKDAPKHDDSEQTIDALLARIADTRAWLGAFAKADFAGAAERVITQPRWEGKVMTGADYFVEYAVPNFFFHLTTAYAILRHNGVPVGKRDFLGTLSQRLPG